MKVAIVCDWLTNVGGAEKVLLAIHQMYPEAPIYTSQYNPKGIDWFKDADVRTGWMQIFPSGLRRFLAPLRQIYFNHLDLSDYDVIFSVTGAEAKSVKKGDAVHFCYCHVPTQYYWGFYDEYVKNPGFGKLLNPIVRFFFKLLVKPLRKADYEAAQKPDYFITISNYAAEMIKKYYGREAKVIAPGVEIEKFSNKTEPKKRSGFVHYSRQVSWKRQDLIIKACIEAGEKLTIIGDGPEHEQLVELAHESKLVKFLPAQKSDELLKALNSAEGFIFPSLEPFGIAPVEALSSGCPVIAYKKGGAADYVIDGKNGVFFEKQNTASIVRAIKKFKKCKFKYKDVVKSAKYFDVARFKREIAEFVNEKTK